MWNKQPVHKATFCQVKMLCMRVCQGRLRLVLCARCTASALALPRSTELHLRHRTNAMLDYITRTARHVTGLSSARPVCFDAFVACGRCTSSSILFVHSCVTCQQRGTAVVKAEKVMLRAGTPRRLLLCMFLGALLNSAVVARVDELREHGDRSLASHTSWYPDEPEQQHLASQIGNSTNATCLGFLIGIGTQKGGTTAAWAYLQHKAHPMLRVSEQKEIGFWDHLHTWYKGCTLGDYQMLVNNSIEDPSLSPIPVCPAPGAVGSMWALHSNRLRSSSTCGIRQQLIEAAAGNGSNVSTSSTELDTAIIHCSRTAVAEVPARPWWRFWSKWSWSSSSTVCVVEPGSGSNVTTSKLADSAAVAANPFLQVDITPSYLYHPVAPIFLRAMLPEARILVILREPVSRAISNFNMKWQKLREAEVRAGNFSFDNLPPAQRKAAWIAQLESNATSQMQQLTACYERFGGRSLQQPELAACMGMKQPYSPTFDTALWSDAMIWQGIYADSLERWFNIFPANQFLVWISEDFRQDPAAHIRQLIGWLGLDPLLLNPKYLPGARPLKPVHVREYEAAAPEQLKQQMKAFYEPHNERLFRVLLDKGFGHVAVRMTEIWAEANSSGSGVSIGSGITRRNKRRLQYRHH